MIARPARRARGFGLLELLVALALVAGAIAAGAQILGAATRGTGDADRYTRAVLLAESRMAELGVIEPLQPGETMGEAGEGYLWRVSVRPHADYVVPPAAADGGLPLVPLEVTVTVAWGLEAQPQEVTLTTLRLVRQRR
ncbi:MAG: prepilin-type N-terminal cleavage/methylation domain-containing protein [Alphaproteobacteria bacterium]|nr:prepilin-type N-terminal cleavage/methylation domain-containing protein [Alphaproteobacteria bacterium]